MNQAEFHFPMPRQAPLRHQPEVTQAPVEDEPPDFSDAATAGRSVYMVRLVDYPHPTADIVRVAEQRFRRELERQLGDDVLRAQRAYVSVTEASEADLTKDEVLLATRWVKAYDAARTAGYRDLGDTQEAYFEVRAI
ncbi:UNVERIFIED_ORG: hypothetical protein ABIC43_000984 [Variovorax guangxiensis]